MKQPKPFLNRFRLRNQAKGRERRLNMSKIILDKGTPFPLPVELQDIDAEFNRWVKEDLDIEYNGKRLPTFKLLSQQQIGEYAQTWQHLDETGNIIMNFKTITRENNPKKGTNQGSVYNAPGNRDYPMFAVPILQENGLEAYDVYSMKQPFTVDLVYSVTIICDKYELLNKMNQLIHDKFKAIECYIAPNKHYMPMVLDNVTDESEYNIDDRRYYSQTYTINVKAYIIQESDFKVTKVPSRMKITLLNGNESFKKPRIEISEEDYVIPECCFMKDVSPFQEKRIFINVNFPSCTKKADFNIDMDFNLLDIKTDNIYDFVLNVNDEVQSLEYETKIYDGDNIKLEIERDDLLKDSVITLVGYDPNVMIDTRYDAESSLDEIADTEIIEYKNL